MSNEPRDARTPRAISGATDKFSNLPDEEMSSEEKVTLAKIKSLIDSVPDVEMIEKERESFHTQTMVMVNDLLESGLSRLAARTVIVHSQWFSHTWIKRGAAACFALLVLIGTAGATYFFTTRHIDEPVRVKLANEGREVLLFSRDDSIIHVWETPIDDGIRDPQLVERPTEYGGGKLVIFGFDQKEANPFPAQLCAFDAFGSRDVPEWTAAINNNEIPIDLLNRPSRNYNGTQFGVQLCRPADIFPDRPGDELIVIFQNGPFSQCSLRVYGLDGTLLYQVWHDGNITDVYWMPSKKQIVCSAVNAEADADQRGIPNSRRNHPRVLFAVTPKLNSISPQWVNTVDHNRGVDPVWYLSLFNAPATDLLKYIKLSQPNPGTVSDAGSGVLCTIYFETLLGYPSIGMLIDGSGQEDIDARLPDDKYNRAVRQNTLPKDELFWWDDLPPIKDSERDRLWIPDTAGHSE